MSHLEQLQEAIRARALRNIDDNDFVPYSWLTDLFTMDKIQQVLDDGATEDYERQDVAKRVRKSGIVTFATLVMIGQPGLIRHFFAQDLGVKNSGPDSKLPLEKKKLEEEFPKYGAKFWEAQYMFSVPMFPQGIPHRIYGVEIRLPFLQTAHDPGASKKKARKGNFGTITKAKLPPIKYGDADTKGGQEYKGEVRCLRLLNSARHESILELCGSYTRGGTHNFLFPEATGGDLHNLLQTDPRPEALSDDETIYRAICGLTSALKNLHCFSNDDMDLKLLGCHHDLKPKNVLVDGARFILADFGLSKITSSQEELEHLDVDRDANFEAPERRDYTVELHPTRGTGRPADIWSLGCILAVLLAYMKGGRLEVENFSEQREFTMNMPGTSVEFVCGSFHQRGQPHEGVARWLAGENWCPSSSTDRTAAEVELVKLIRKMLSIEPSVRPEISDVVRCLRCITLKKASEPIQAYLQSQPSADTTDGRNVEEQPGQSMGLEYAVERQVFLEWLNRIDGASLDPEQQFLGTHAVFAQVYSTVCAIRDEFRLLADAAREDTPLFARLRRLNSQLLAPFGPADRSSVRTLAELKVMPKAQEMVRKSRGSSGVAKSLTVRPRLGPGESTPNEKVKMLLCAANVARLMEKSQSAVPKVDPEKVTLLSRSDAEASWHDTEEEENSQSRDGDASESEENEDGIESDEVSEDAGEEYIDREEEESREVRSFRLGNLTEDGSTTPVIAEELEILSADYNQEKMSERLFSSLEMVMSLPREQASLFRSLSCAGICLDAQQKRIRLLYRYPDTPAGVDTQRRPRVLHLAEVLGMFHFTNPIDPVLGLFVSINERLRLARDLAAAVFEFHKIEWWHKSISSYNVLLFFYDDTIQVNRSSSRTRNEGNDAPLRKLSLGRPSLIGFSHSRPGNADYSNKMHGDSARVPYRHPRYAGADAPDASKAAGYLAEYDYYSLGLVLLEIGLRCRLRRFATDRTQTREEMRQELLLRWVPLLEGTLGALFASAVESCLSGVLGGSGKNPESDIVDEKFEQHVLRPLERCQLP
ncbi:hypothetical protein QQZ08_009652 [Neonectria magnoliae]|uniref:Protein kinase domain-containing protein n=1 Tax=Neonectria magnoliae TaxID=2732573 RepID=A0ABR1HM13_9HYPO